MLNLFSWTTTSVRSKLTMPGVDETSPLAKLKDKWGAGAELEALSWKILDQQMLALISAVRGSQHF